MLVKILYFRDESVSGSRVDWKLYSPFSTSQQQFQQRNVRAESGTAVPSNVYIDGNQAALIRPAVGPEDRPQQPVPTATAAVPQEQIQYKPFEMAPPHIRQLMQHMLEPQIPYIDPSVYLYQIGQPQEPQHLHSDEQQQRSFEDFNSLGGGFLGSSSEESSVQVSAASSPQPQQPRYYGPKFPRNKAKLGLIRYPFEPSPAPAPAPAPIQPQSQYVSYGIGGSNSGSEEKESPNQEQKKQDDMPQAIHELLKLQAQIPYHIIADKIVYKPKSMFVPKPFSDEDENDGGEYDKSSGYRTKIYYVGDAERESESGEGRQQQQQRSPRFAQSNPASGDNTQEQTDE
ncbi:hypothetical protein QAD02_010474 [Eretmocerus hayati]|uniref:Uncharacterized protein n=1 Tax=Eretmocerus hayati TaxID=131215 RepID=A0ACC2NUZ4_9HYME|nr:hypothetical protein QAD02_010474 [Eretmocerus hayati]